MRTALLQLALMMSAVAACADSTAFDQLAAAASADGNAVVVAPPAAAGTAAQPPSSPATQSVLPAAAQGKSFEAVFDAETVGQAAEFSSIIPPGKSVTFDMPSFGSFVDDMHPSYSVKLTAPFEMQVTLVTQLQYFIVTGEDPSHSPPKPWYGLKGCSTKEDGIDTGTKTKSGSEIVVCKNDPVVSVTWHDAQSFIKKLNDPQNGLSGGRHCTYRLPTKGEWGYADRDKQPPFPDYSSAYGYCEKHPDALKSNSFGVNTFGLLDMNWIQLAGDEVSTAQLCGGTNLPENCEDWSYSSGGQCLGADPDNWEIHTGFRLVRTCQ